MASRTRYPQKDTIRDNKEISSNLQSLHNEYPTLNSDKDKLPTFFKPFAGQAVLPAALVHYCLTQKPTLRLTIAIRGAVGESAGSPAPLLPGAHCVSQTLQGSDALG